MRWSWNALEFPSWMGWEWEHPEKFGSSFPGMGEVGSTSGITKSNPKHPEQGWDLENSNYWDNSMAGAHPRFWNSQFILSPLGIWVFQLFFA